MNNLPRNVQESIRTFVEGCNRILGKRIKKLYYMVLMLEVITIRHLI